MSKKILVSSRILIPISSSHTNKSDIDYYSYDISHGEVIDYRSKVIGFSLQRFNYIYFIFIVKL